MEGEELMEHCQAVRSELFAAVEAGLENTRHTNSRPVPAFLCPIQNDSCSTELHTAHLSDNGKKWICSENSDVFDIITRDQEFWLSGPGKKCFIDLFVICSYLVFLQDLLHAKYHWHRK